MMQTSITATDRAHPRFAEYLAQRASNHISFVEWLVAQEAEQLARLTRVATLPDAAIDTSEMPVIGDWSDGVRGGTPADVRRKQAAMIAKWAAHEQYPAFLAWMRDNQGGARQCPGASTFPDNFRKWLTGVRW